MERLGEWMPQLPLAMLVGLCLSICFRKQPWVAVVWVPTLISFGTVFLIILSEIVGLFGLRGPDAGWGGSRTHRFTVMEGLKAIAGTLEDLDKACREIRAAPVGKKTSLESYRDQIARLCAWAGVDNDGSHPAAALDRVQQKLLEISRPLVDFCLANNGGEDQHPGLLSQLGMLNRPRMEEFVERLRENPPDDMQSALSWSGVFHRMKASKGELKELVESPNPLLQAAARDAVID